MRVLLIDKTSKIVVNAIVADETYENEDYIVVASEEEGGIGDIYDETEGTFTHPEPEIDRREEILQELNEIDRKSIRALRANETDYIAMYEQQAQALREELHQLGESIE